MVKIKCKLGGKVPSGGLPCLMCGYLNSTVVSGWKCEHVEDQDKSKRMKVITLCGSTKFKDQFLEQQKRLTLEGNVVISVGLFGHSGDEEVWKPGMKEMLDKMHFQKIDMADEIFVINVGGYIGESTKREIAHAEQTGKVIRYLELIE